jgi:hypothetical protein
MDEITDPLLLDLRSKLPAETWQTRLANARAWALVCEGILARQAEGMALGTAIRKAAPDPTDPTWRHRLERYRQGGWQGLIDRRVVAAPETKLTPMIGMFMVGLKMAEPSMSSEEVSRKVHTRFGVELAPSTIRGWLHENGVETERTAPPPPRVEDLPLAGCELLMACDERVGAVSALAAGLQRALKDLPAADPAAIVDDKANRDEKGRFLPGYNESQGKDADGRGWRFRAAAEVRLSRDPHALQVSQASWETLYRKCMAVTLLPVVISTPRWEGLEHWQGQQLEPLVGWGYRAGTIEKFVGQLKLAGMADPARESVASFWIRRESKDHPVEGAVLVYVDTMTKPIRTNHFSRSLPIARLGGRILPGTSTVFLHSGCGTPLVYRAFSGHTSLPEATTDLLARVEGELGDSSVRRVVVIDREAHQVAFFKKLMASGWSFIIPLKESVTRDPARFQSRSAWSSYGTGGDEVCEDLLTLRDGRKNEKDLVTRVVGRRRARTGHVSWYATAVPKEELDAVAVIDAYFARWPNQEHVFRDGVGRIGLQVHHGFGKKLTTNIAVVTRTEKLGAQLQKLEAERSVLQAATPASPTPHAGSVNPDDAPASASAVPLAPPAVVERAHDRVLALRAEVEADRQAGRQGTPPAQERRAFLAHLDAWLAAQLTLAVVAPEAARAAARLLVIDATIDQKTAERDRLLAQQEVFTIDTELDEVMTAFKLTFMNLCRVFVSRCLKDEPVELNTLIQAVLTLPGQRITTPAIETVRIWRQPRERRFMPLVEHAIEVVNGWRLRRGKRLLRFELADRPDDSKGRPAPRRTTGPRGPNT